MSKYTVENGKCTFECMNSLDNFLIKTFISKVQHDLKYKFEVATNFNFRNRKFMKLIQSEPH